MPKVSDKKQKDNKNLLSLANATEKLQPNKIENFLIMTALLQPNTREKTVSSPPHIPTNKHKSRKNK